MAIAKIMEGGIAIPTREASIDAIGYTIYRNALTANPTELARAITERYKTNSTISRTVNQVVEQVIADANILPVVPSNQKVTDALQAWWKATRMGHILRRGFKEFVLAGETWNYVPRLPKSKGVRVRPLIPWGVQRIEGYSAVEWDSALYSDPITGSIFTLTPQNTAYVAHDALFGELRGLSPFASLFFAVRTYEDWLQGRVRINRLAGNVVGRMRFPDVQSAAASLPNARIVQDGDTPRLEITGPVDLPPSGSVAVLIGEDADFQLMTPNVGAYTARDDGEFMWRAVVEATRLPEFLSGWARGVNVATARVQYPFAIRMMLAIRDEYDDAMVETLRLVIRRMVEHKVLPPSWRGPNGETITPETADVALTWPEVRELDFATISQTVISLMQLGAIDAAAALKMLGFDDQEITQLQNEAAEAGETLLEKMEAILDDWLQRKLDEVAGSTQLDGGQSEATE